MEQSQTRHGEWSSRLTFIMAASSAAIGLGNIWKFPYITGENGGGAFVLMYLLCVIVMGLPIMMTEILIGRRARKNPAGAMALLAEQAESKRSWKFLGWLIIAAGFIILSYYGVIAGWALHYTKQAASGIFHNASAENIGQIFDTMVSDPGTLILNHSLIMFGSILVVGLGVKKGLERAVLFLFPAMLFLLLLLVGYAMKTGFFKAGLDFLFTPNFSKLSSHNALVAMGHAFFTLSIAVGTITVYGAYLPKKISIAAASFWISVADTAIALIAGMAIFPIVFAHHLQPGSGPGLIFKTLPLAFGHMQYGSFFATLFFLMLVFAAFTSAISMLEPTVVWMIEECDFSRWKATLIAGLAIWLLGFGTVFSFNLASQFKWFNLNFFDLLDYLTANIMLPLGGLALAIFAGWVMKKEDTQDELNLQSPVLYAAWRFTLRYITPVGILFIFLDFIGVLKF